jgi:hypothetical protein
MASGDQERTLGIWWFVVAFTLVTALGLVLVLTLGGSDTTGTEVVPTSQTLPD